METWLGGWVPIYSSKLWALWNCFKGDALLWVWQFSSIIAAFRSANWRVEHRVCFQKDWGVNFPLLHVWKNYGKRTLIPLCCETHRLQSSSKHKILDCNLKFPQIWTLTRAFGLVLHSMCGSLAPSTVNTHPSKQKAARNWGSPGICSTVNYLCNI